MKRFLRATLSALAASGPLLILMSTSGCGNGGSTTRATLPPAVADAVTRKAVVPDRTVAANNKFGFQLLSQLSRSAPASDNVFISPTSLALVLEIIYNGAQGDTQTEMATALQLQNPSADAVNADNAALQASLTTQDPNVEVKIANSLWTRDGLIKPAFVSLNQQYYGSELGNIKGAPANVNDWVNAQTGGRIPTILPDKDYSSTIAIVVNAIYFRADWSKPFDPGLTQDAAFHSADGSTPTVKMMRQQDVYGYYKGDHFQMVRLPYASGRLSMLLLLPDADSDLKTLIGALTPENWSAWIAGLQNKGGDIALPRLTSRYGVNMNDTLRALGMKLAFDPDLANLSSIAQIPGQNVYLQDVYHKTFLKMDEKGTEAAAASAGTIGVTSAPLSEFAMTLDRPFLCAVRDEKTGVVLFLGAINHP